MSNVTRIPRNTDLQAHWNERDLGESFEMIRSRIVKDSYGLPMAFKTGMAPTDEERRAGLEAAASTRFAWQTVATVKDHKTAVRLLGGGLKLSAGTDFEGVAEAYLFVLDGVKAKALQTAVFNLLKGKAPERFSKTFMPAAPELLSYCEELERDAIALVDSTEQLLRLPEEKFEEPMSEEHCARMREKIQALASNLRSA